MKIAPSVMIVLGVTLALAAFCSDSCAQDKQGRRDGGRRGPGGGGFGGPGGGDPISGLLRSKEVREELNITDEQVAAIKKMSEGNRPKRPEGVNFGDMSEEDRADFFKKMQAERAKRAAEMKEQLEEVLLPNQIERAEQIALQVQGARALGQAEVAEKLGITEQQKQQLKEVQDSLHDEMRDKMREMISGGNRNGMREKMMELRKEIEEKVLAVLTEDQKSKFEEMKGKPFEMPETLGRGGGRGGDAGRGGRRGGERGGGERGGRRGGGRDRPESEE